MQTEVESSSVSAPSLETLARAFIAVKNRSTVEPMESIALSIALPKLYHLMENYTERLKEQTSLLGRRRRTISLSHDDDEVSEKELAQDVYYLANRTSRLVSKASAYRETAEMSEIDQLEIELHLFDAEHALRAAGKVLNRFGMKSRRKVVQIKRLHKTHMEEDMVLQLTPGQTARQFTGDRSHGLDSISPAFGAASEVIL